MSLGCLVDKAADDISYRDQNNVDRLKVGLVLYINLRFLKGVL